MSEISDLFAAIDGPCTCGAPYYDELNCPYCNSVERARLAAERLESECARLVARIKELEEGNGDAGGMPVYTSSTIGIRCEPTNKIYRQARRDIGLDIGPGARNLHMQHAQATVAWLEHLRTMQENAPQSEWGVKWSNTLARRVAALKWLIRQAEAGDE